ncbi:hypothetical protein [Deinococcus alpinitundrae]|uniref:hypothetical protein n=1 Tax=Deinococcus alpinitundrae TaxID=468913 RepID=UPI001379C78E|nr:hypothetical protein [Deinococcus alpinitundrae]
MNEVPPPARTPLAHDGLGRVPFLGGLEVLPARFVKQAFAHHTHEGFTVGVVRRSSGIGARRTEASY